MKSTKCNCYCEIIVISYFLFYGRLGWVDVLWDDGSTNSYRLGAEGKFDVMVIPRHHFKLVCFLCE